MPKSHWRQSYCPVHELIRGSLEHFQSISKRSGFYSTAFLGAFAESRDSVKAEIAQDIRRCPQPALSLL